MIARSLALFACTGILVASAGKPDPWGKHADGMADVNGRFAIDAPLTVGELAVYPVVDRAAADLALTYASVGEAMAAGALKVDELQDGASVNTLQVDNFGDEPILLLAGDVFFGGNQDRIITRDVVVPAHTEDVPIAVHCVEQGRWQANGAFAYGGRAEVALSRAVQTAASQDVTWSTVSKLNSQKAVWATSAGRDARQFAPSTDTYQASMRAMPEAHATALSLMQELARRERVVGIVVAYGDRVVASELYSHPAQFARHRDASLAAIALEATSRPLSGEAPSPTIAAAFLKDAVDSLDAGPRANGEHTVSVATRGVSGEFVRLASYAR
ncbi:MAG: hypothetical protein EP330_30635 [Deltaproteobacteria bacterium]|nr:MAG: hypothetical protein EP330_30635 [Deltaproteobacteria bacterium]